MNPSVVGSALCLSLALAQAGSHATQSLSSQAPARPERKEHPQRNVLLIVLDDVGIDKIAMYGQTPGPYVTLPYSCTPATLPFAYAPTPNLERLASGQVLANGRPIGGGTRFTNVFANPVCSPTRACLMTGRYAFRTGIGAISDAPNFPAKVPNAEKFLPELLKTGLSTTPYTSGAFGKWHMTTATGDDSHAVDNGFDIFQGHMRNLTNHYVYRKVTSYPGMPVSYEGINGTVDPVTHEFSASPNPVYDVTRWNGHITTVDATNWINAQTTPYFAYVAYSPPHGVSQVPPFDRLSASTVAELSNPLNCGGAYSPGDLEVDFNERDAILERIFFRAMLEAVDSEIGRLIDGIDPSKLANTMIFVIGDNGTTWPIIDPTHNVNHGKGTVYEWGTHVPLIVCGPLVPTSPSFDHVCAGQVDAVDVWRTIADLTGASVTATAPLQPLDSLSFYPLITNPNAPSARQYSFCQYFTPNGAYTPTPAGPYDPGPPVCQPPPPSASCPMVELTLHARSVTDGAHRYVRKQLAAGVDGFPQGQPDTPPTYTEELYDLSVDVEEVNNLLPPPPQVPSPAVQAILDPLRTYMLNLSGH